VTAGIRDAGRAYVPSKNTALPVAAVAGALGEREPRLLRVYADEASHAMRLGPRPAEHTKRDEHSRAATASLRTIDPSLQFA
jgi:hypothetical protein